MWLYAGRRACSAAALVPHLPRLAPHVAVLSCVAAAVAAGEFGRPEPPFVVPLGLEYPAFQVSTGSARLVAAPRLPDSLPRDSLMRPALLTTLPPAKPRYDLIRHMVAPGDTAWSIGEQYQVGMYTVLWANGLKEDSLLHLGQELVLPPVPGTLHTVTPGDSLDSIARRYGVDPGQVVEANDLRPGDRLPEGRVLVVPDGQLPLEATAPALRLRPPPVAALPAPRVPVPGPRLPLQAPAAPPAPQAAVATGRLQWPTRGVITTYFSGWHPGIDIAASLGTPIRAADGGRVVSAGWNNTGYGYRIVVSHGNGYVTTYNHLSAINVSVGAAVGRGQVIGRMGSTGRSTGPHLHFEIMVGNRFANPLGVLGN